MRKTVNFQGKNVPGEVVDFQSPPENFVNYALSDGSNIKIKTVLLEVVRILDQYGPTGDPVYMFSAQQIINVVAADNLKQVKH